MQNYRIGFVPLARTTFDMPLAAEVTQAARRNLTGHGFELIGPQELVTDGAGVQQAINELSAAPIDLLLVFQATFADSSAVTALAEAIKAPLFLWAVPEERTGGRLRLNSFCGINLGGHALRLNGKSYNYYYGNPDEPGAASAIREIAAAGYVVRRFKNARMGVVGTAPGGLDSCILDEDELSDHFGIQVVKIELERVFSQVRSLARGSVDRLRAELNCKVENLNELDTTKVDGTLGVYTILKKIATEEKLDGLAVRCWPEFFTDLGCASCGAMSMLTDDGLPCSCEADANGTVTQLVLQWLSGEQAFGSDVVSFDYKQDNAVLWHCGLAPLSMADPVVKPRVTIHSNRKMPLLMEFPLKPGRVTLARFSRASGELRLVAGGGEMLSAPPSYSGTSGVLRFDRPAHEVLDTILTEGLEHHISLTYGDYRSSLMAMARLLNLPVLRLS
jgi:L-fucose isomerase-like protein